MTSSRSVPGAAHRPGARRAVTVLMGSVGLAGLQLATAGPASAHQPFPACAVDVNNRLVQFDTSTPGDVTVLSTLQLGPGEVFRAADRRTADDVAYAVVSQADGSAARLVTIDMGSGAVREVAALSLSGTTIDMDWSTKQDRLWVLSESGTVDVVSPDGSTIVSEPAPVYAGGTAPRLQALAFNRPTPTQHNGSELFWLDASPTDGTAIMADQNPLEARELHERGRLSLRGEVVGLEFGRPVTAWAVTSTATTSSVYYLYQDGRPDTADPSQIKFVGDVGHDAPLVDLTECPRSFVAAQAQEDDPEPVVPELPLALLAPVSAAAVGGTALAVRRRREMSAV